MKNNDLIEKLEKSLERVGHHYEMLRQSEAVIARRQSLKSLAEELRKVGLSKSIADILNAEHEILISENHTYGNDNVAARKQIENLIQSLLHVLRVYECVFDKDAYKNIDALYYRRIGGRKNGLPKDAFHIFVCDNESFLSKRMENPLFLSEEYLLLNARRENLKIAQAEYARLQANTLGIPIPRRFLLRNI